MPDKGNVVRLGDVLMRSNERLGGAPEPEILTCTEREGLIRQSDKFSHRVASNDTSKYKVVRPFDLVFNPYLLWLGAIGQNHFGWAGITSPVYEVFRPVEAIIDPGFAGLLLSHPSMLPKYDSISIGSIPRRRRATAERFVDLDVQIPELPVQRRIADAVRSISVVVSRVRIAESSAEQALGLVREDAVRRGATSEIALGELLEGVEAGSSPEGENRRPLEGERAVLKVSAVRPGWFDPEQVKVIALEKAMPEKARLKAGDVLITRANTRDLVGSACLVVDPPADYFLSDKTLRLIPGPDLLPAFLVELLRVRSVRQQIEDAATGTSASMKNISQESIRHLRVPTLDVSSQRNVVSVLASLRSSVMRYRGLSAQASRAQRSVVSALLFGTHEIPESYDALLTT